MLGFPLKDAGTVSLANIHASMKFEWQRIDLGTVRPHTSDLDEVVRVPDFDHNKNQVRSARPHKHVFCDSFRHENAGHVPQPETQWRNALI